MASMVSIHAARLAHVALCSPKLKMIGEKLDMKRSIATLSAVAVAGMLIGLTSSNAYADNHADGAHDGDHKTADNGCSGKDGCNGKDSCKGKEASEDKDSCKAKEGCKAKDSCKGHEDHGH